MADRFSVTLLLAALICSTVKANNLESQWNELLGKVPQDGATLNVNNFIDEALGLVHRPEISRKLEPFYLVGVKDCNNCSVNGISSARRTAPAQLALSSPRTVQLRTTIAFPNINSTCYCERIIVGSRATFNVYITAVDVSVSGSISQETTPGSSFTVTDLTAIVPPQGLSVQAQTSNRHLLKSQSMYRVFIKKVRSSVENDFANWLQLGIREAVRNTNIQTVAKFLTN